MKDIFLNMNEDGELLSSIRLEIESNPSIAIEQIYLKFASMEKNYSESDIVVLVDLYNNFYESNSFTEHLLQNMYKFYILKIDSMIYNDELYSIYLLIDLFYSNGFPELFSEEFARKTYPILFINTDNLTTPISISAIRYISILKIMKNNELCKELMFNYLDSGNLTYRIYILDQLEKMGNVSN